MFELSDLGKNLEIIAKPIKLSILNLVNTQGLDNIPPMQPYSFVNKEIIKSMDNIADKIKEEIIEMTRKRENYFK